MVIRSAQAADSGGNFTVSITPSKMNGETVKVTATDSSNNESQPTSAVAPDITAPGTPIITAVTDDQPMYGALSITAMSPTIANLSWKAPPKQVLRSKFTITAPC